MRLLNMTRRPEGQDINIEHFRNCDSFILILFSLWCVPALISWCLYPVIRQLELKHLYLKLMGLFFSYLAWAFGISLANSRSWRVWEFTSNIVSIVYIGLWEAFYFQKCSISGAILEWPMYGRINGSWVISDEIWYGQGLILLANSLNCVVLIFGSVALVVRWIHVPYPDFLRLCYNISAFFLICSCSCTAVTASWNFAVDFYGQTTLDFPLSFPIGKEMLIRKRFSYVFPLGITTATLSLISAAMSSVEHFPRNRGVKWNPWLYANIPQWKVWMKVLLFAMAANKFLEEMSYIHIILLWSSKIKPICFQGVSDVLFSSSTFFCKHNFLSLKPFSFWNV